MLMRIILWPKSKQRRWMMMDCWFLMRTRKKDERKRGRSRRIKKVSFPNHLLKSMALRWSWVKKSREDLKIRRNPSDLQTMKDPPQILRLQNSKKSGINLKKNHPQRAINGTKSTVNLPIEWTRSSVSKLADSKTVKAKNRAAVAAGEEKNNKEVAVVTKDSSWVISSEYSSSSDLIN